MTISVFVRVYMHPVQCSMLGPIARWSSYLICYACHCIVSLKSMHLQTDVHASRSHIGGFPICSLIEKNSSLYSILLFNDMEHYVTADHVSLALPGCTWNVVCRRSVYFCKPYILSLNIIDGQSVHSCIVTRHKYIWGNCPCHRRERSIVRVFERGLGTSERNLAATAQGIFRRFRPWHYAEPPSA